MGEQWIPVTKLGRLVKDGKIKSLEEIYLFSLPIKECEIIDYFLGSSLKDEVLKIIPSRSRRVPVSVRGSRLLSPSVIATVTLVSASNAPRRWPLPFEALSSSLSSRSFLSVEDTGVTRSVNPTPYRAKLQANVAAPSCV